MNPARIRAAAELLAEARRHHEPIDCIPAAVRPTSLPEAYAVQAELERLLGWEVAGWFCACTNPVIQSMLGLSEPYYARLFAPFIYESEAELDADDFPPMVLECEFGFRLKQDLPPRAKPYTRVEVETAVASVHPTLEVVAGHLRNWPEQDVFSVIADNGTDGALVYGPGVEAWQSIDLARVEVALSVNGQRVRTGTGQNVMGDPMDALVWLANARARDGNGLKSGHLHNTGTATDIIWVERGDEAVVTFTELGAAALRVV